jgi:hypothetical protein
VYNNEELNKKISCCLNITKLTTAVTDESEFLVPGYEYTPSAILTKAFNITLDGSFYNDVNETLFKENCSNLFIYPSFEYFKILPNTNIESQQVSIGDEIVNTTELKPGIEEIVEVKIIFHNYVMG